MNWRCLKVGFRIDSWGFNFDHSLISKSAHVDGIKAERMAPTSLEDLQPLNPACICSPACIEAQIVAFKQ